MCETKSQRERERERERQRESERETETDKKRDRKSIEITYFILKWLKKGYWIKLSGYVSLWIFYLYRGVNSLKVHDVTLFLFK